MAIEITAEQAGQMTGRCAYHSSALQLVAYADDGLKTMLDGWWCPGYQDDPEVKAVNEESGAISAAHPVPWDMKPQDARDRLHAGHEILRQVRKKCDASWVFSVPDPAG